MAHLVRVGLTVPPFAKGCMVAAFLVLFRFTFQRASVLTRGLQRDVVYVSLLTKSTLVYESQCRGMGGGGVAVSQPMNVHIT